MERNSILYLLQSQDLTEKKIDLFREKLKDKNFTIDDCDKLLRKLGYENMFSFEGNLEKDEDDVYQEIEPIRARKVVIDE